jgi:hypothetical protein
MAKIRVTPDCGEYFRKKKREEAENKAGGGKKG